MTLNQNNKVCKIASFLDRGYGSGFYSLLYFSMNHYIFCKKNKVDFTIQSNDWLFKYKEGWMDYFEDNTIKFLENNNTKNNIMNKIKRLNIKYYSTFKYHKHLDKF